MVSTHPAAEAFFIIGLLLLWIFILVVFNKTVKIIRHGQVMIIERFGKYQRTLKPGCHIIIPFVDSPRTVHWRYLEVTQSGAPPVVNKIETDRIDMREHVIDFERRHVITKDTVQIEMDALVYFRITDARSAVYKIQNLPDAIELLTQSTLRNIIASLTLDETFSSRETINAQLLEHIEVDAVRWGVTIIRVEVVNIVPPRDIKEAMERQIKEERERRSTVIQADGDRESSIIRSRGDAAKLVLEAEGQKISALQRAKGEATAKMLLADAEVTYVRSLQEALKQSAVSAAQYSAALEYLDSLQRMTATNKPANVYLLPEQSVQMVGGVFKPKSA